MILNFIQSVVLILLLCGLQLVNVRYWHGRSLPAQITSGFLFGITAIVNMMGPLVLAPGFFIDARLAILSMAALFGGPLVGMLAAGLAIAYRLGIGGGGAYFGAASMLFAVVFGLGYRHASTPGWIRKGSPQLTGFSVLVHACALLLLVRIPELRETPLDLAIITMAITMPATTLMLGLLLEDLQRRSSVQHELAQSEARMHAITRAIPDLLLVLDEDGRYLEIVSPNQQRHLLYDEAVRLQGKRMHDVLPALKADRLLAFVREAIATNEPQEIEYTLKIGAEHRTFEGRAQALDLDLDGKRAVVMVTRDISARKAAEAEIQQLAFFDALTDLPNRRRLLDRLQHVQAHCAKTGKSGALLCIDLDDFRNINDLYGNPHGDQILQQVARRLEELMWEYGMVARLGGDECAVLLEGLPAAQDEAAEQAAQAGQRLLDGLREPYRLGDSLQSCTGSIGIILFGAAEPEQDLLHKADLALSAAKESGKNGLHFFDPAIQDEVSARLRLENEIRLGLQNGEFIVYYQPQIDAQGNLRGAEALVRWQHPQRGLLAPGFFLPAAERAGLLQQMDRQVFDTACRQLAHWASHPQLNRMSVSVNISAVQLHQADFVQQILDGLARHDAPASMLMLELTESLLVGDLAKARSHMKEIKQHGVRFALDDFGTGYSSLSYLPQLPLDELKIDQSFVRSLPADNGNLAIIHAITALAASFGFEVVAEGVETEAQLAILAGCGCLRYQGYLFAKPMSAEALEQFAVDRQPHPLLSQLIPQ